MSFGISQKVCNVNLLEILTKLLHSRWAVSYHCKYMAQVYSKGLEVGVRKAVSLLLFQGLSILINMNYTILYLQLIVQVFRNTLHGVWVLPFTRVRPDVCR